MNQCTPQVAPFRVKLDTTKIVEPRTLPVG